MKLGYGKNRAPADLRRAGADRVWIDTDETDRAERADLFENAMRRGSVLLILSRSDLGAGREIERFEALAARAGAAIEIAEPPEPPARMKPGPAPKFQPDDRQAARIKRYWHGPFKPGEVLRIASEEMGHPVTRNMLNRAFGPRQQK